MVVLGIRPDFIRTSEVLRLLKSHPEVEATFVHTGQHYDRVLNDVFFEELEIPCPDIQLDTRGKNHNEQHSKLIIQLSDVLEQIRPDCVVFLGDANATIGCIAPLKLGIPIAHIEAGMRSFDWRMPEERNRVVIDRISDVLYVYHENYKVNLVREGICPTKIVNAGNVIVDVIRKWENKCLVVDPAEYALMTLHRNEHVTNPRLAQQIIDSVACATDIRGLPVTFIEMPRIKQLGLQYPSNFIVTEPLGFLDFLRIERYASIIYTDSGTSQEEAAIFGVPCVVTRNSTERPETFECGISTLAHEPGEIEEATQYVLRNKYKKINLGNGNSSQLIVDDLVDRLNRGAFDISKAPWEDNFKRKNF